MLDDSTFMTLLIITGVGLAIFVLAMFLDGVFDLGDFPILHALGIFIAGGAATVMIVRGFGVVSLLIAIICGAITGMLLVFIMVKIIAAAKASEHAGREVDFEPLIGAKVDKVWWDGTVGDVIVNVSGQYMKVPAESEEELSKDTPLQVADFEQKGDQLVKVFVETAH